MDTDKRAKLHQILDIVLDTNGFEMRKHGMSGDKPTMFFQFSGHINTAIVELYSNGWTAVDNPGNNWWIDLDKDIPQSLIEDIKGATSKAVEGK